MSAKPIAEGIVTTLVVDGEGVHRVLFPVTGSNEEHDGTLRTLGGLWVQAAVFREPQWTGIILHAPLRKFVRPRVVNGENIRFRLFSSDFTECTAGWRIVFRRTGLTLEITGRRSTRKMRGIVARQGDAATGDIVDLFAPTN